MTVDDGKVVWCEGESDREGLVAGDDDALEGFQLQERLHGEGKVVTELELNDLFSIT